MITLEDIALKVVREFIAPNFKTRPSTVGFNYHGDDIKKVFVCGVNILIEDFHPDTDGIEPHFFDEPLSKYLKENGISDFGSLSFFEFDQYGLEALYYVDFSVVREYMNIRKLKNQDVKNMYSMSTVLEVNYEAQ